MRPQTPTQLTVVSWSWPEVAAGDDLADLVCHCPDLRDGDIVVLTSKVVSKAEGRGGAFDRADLIARDTARVVARKGHTVIAQTSHGLVLAAAGVDASNVPPGHALSLPVDPDATAGRLRAEILRKRGINVAVVITDTAGRAWRIGQVDIAIGCAGMLPVRDLAGSIDPHGNQLVVTAPVTADEVAAAADLVKGKTSGRPLAVLRGMPNTVLTPGDDGPGASAIIRPADSDMFGLGARDSVIAATRRDPIAGAHLPATSSDDLPPFAEIECSDPQLRVTIATVSNRESDVGWECQFDVHHDAEPAAWTELGRLSERLELLAWAHRLRQENVEPLGTRDPGWRAVSRTRWIVA